MATALVASPANPNGLAYFRVTSPAVHTLLKNAKPLPVGLLACQRDPLLRELSTTLVSWQAVAAAPVASKKKKKGPDSEPLDDRPLFDVVLHDTVLFPEGGGQPSDIGHMVLANGDSFDVLSVRRVGLLAVHTVRPAQTVTLATAPDAGDSVNVSLGDDGWARRYDHMCMHTSQHLLSTLMEEHCALATLAWSLTSYPSPSYIEVPRAPTADEIARVQAALDAVTSLPRRVWVEVHDMEGAADGVPAEPNAELRQSFKGIPDDYAGGGVKRTICIDGIDRNACCGTHLPDLQGVNVFILPQTESISRGSVRVFFVAGPRVLALLSSSHALLSGAAAAFGCAASQVPARAAQEFDGRRKSEKRIMELEAEIARSLATELLQRLHSASNGDIQYLVHHRSDDSPYALALLDEVQKSFIPQAEASRQYVVALSCGPSSGTGTTVALVFGSAAEEAAVKRVGETLKAAGVKGGGKGPRWSGKILPGAAWDEGSLLAAVERAKAIP
ncbi:ThrRS/AlaRS common domain-containing protein [Auricularia subglabra TFB-10046 SS5]|nr:ThrRS/AlaRS common domain-containing protein [Auricularia subglabra TFB-10046 SS5]